MSRVCSCCEAGRLLERRLAGAVPWAQLQGGCQAAHDSRVCEGASRATWALSVTVGRCLHRELGTKTGELKTERKCLAVDVSVYTWACKIK